MTRRRIGIAMLVFVSERRQCPAQAKGYQPRVIHLQLRLIRQDPAGKCLLSMVAAAQTTLASVRALVHAVVKRGIVATQSNTVVTGVNRLLERVVPEMGSEADFGDGGSFNAHPSYFVWNGVLEMSGRLRSGCPLVR